MDPSAFVRNLDEEELRALVNHSPSAMHRQPFVGDSEGMDNVRIAERNSQAVLFMRSRSSIGVKLDRDVAGVDSASRRHQ